MVSDRQPVLRQLAADVSADAGKVVCQTRRPKRPMALAETAAVAASSLLVSLRYGASAQKKSMCRPLRGFLGTYHDSASFCRAELGEHLRHQRALFGLGVEALRTYHRVHQPVRTRLAPALNQIWRMVIALPETTVDVWKALFSGKRAVVLVCALARCLAWIESGLVGDPACSARVRRMP